MQVPTFYIRVVRLSVFGLIAAILPCTAYAQTPVPYTIVFDSYMTPAAGAQGLLTVQHLLATAEDRWLPLKIGEERSRPALAVGILYRAGKFFALDIPQDHFFLVVAHEVFGHGARFRELGEGRIRYGFDAPIPYGSGDALRSSTAVSSVSAGQSQCVRCRHRAQHALADAIAERAGARPEDDCTIVRHGSTSSRAWPPSTTC